MTTTRTSQQLESQLPTDVNQALRKKISYFMLCLCLLITVFTGCAGNYAQHYVELAKCKYTGKTPKLILVDSLPNNDSISKYGLRAIGYSIFYEYNSSNPNVDAAVLQGKYVGADFVVLLRPKFVSSSVALVNVPHVLNAYSTTNQQMSINTRGSISDSYGMPVATYRGTSTGTTNSQTQTTIEYTTQEYRRFDRYIHGGLFLKAND